MVEASQPVILVVRGGCRFSCQWLLQREARCTYPPPVGTCTTLALSQGPEREKKKHRESLPKAKKKKNLGPTWRGPLRSPNPRPVLHIGLSRQVTIASLPFFCVVLPPLPVRSRRAAHSAFFLLHVVARFFPPCLVFSLVKCHRPSSPPPPPSRLLDPPGQHSAATTSSAQRQYYGQPAFPDLNVQIA